MHTGHTSFHIWPNGRFLSDTNEISLYHTYLSSLTLDLSINEKRLVSIVSIKKNLYYQFHHMFSRFTRYNLFPLYVHSVHLYFIDLINSFFPLSVFVFHFFPFSFFFEKYLHIWYNLIYWNNIVDVFSFKRYLVSKKVENLFSFVTLEKLF